MGELEIEGGRKGDRLKLVKEFFDIRLMSFDILIGRICYSF